MLVLRRVLNQFCEDNKLTLADPLAISAARELMRMWQAGDPTEAELVSDLAHLAAAHSVQGTGGSRRFS